MMAGSEPGQFDADNVTAAPVQAGSITALFAELKNCDPAVLNELCRRFFPRIAGIARKTLSKFSNRNADADDVAQSVFISFWKTLSDGREFEFSDRNDLWNLLALMTARKAGHVVRSELTQKRGGGQTRNESDLYTARGENSSVRLDQLLSTTSPPEFDLCCEEMLLSLDESNRAIAILRLNGYSTTEVAAMLACSPRSVQRSLESIRDQWEKLNDDG